MSYYKPEAQASDRIEATTFDKTIVLQTSEFAPSLDLQRSPKLTSSASLLPADLLGIRFCQWFSHTWDFIYSPMPAAGEKAQWLTEKRYPLEPRTLWRKYQDPDELIGLRFSNDGTRYCLIDIDRGSAYHPANNFSGFKDVLAALEEIGLSRPVVVRSSDSDGIHVYYFLPDLLPTFGLASSIRFALEDAGLELRCGQLESFPNTKAYVKHGRSLYNGHRLPLQVDSYLLDDDAQPLSDDLEQFLNAADVAAAHQDLAALKKAIAVAKKRPKHKYTPSASNDVQKRKREIEQEIAEGWTGFHQTNNLLIRIADHARFWLDLRGQELASYIEETAIAAPGYKEYCRHQHEIGKRCAEVAKMAEDYWTVYCSYPERYGKSYQANFGQQGQQNNIVEFSPNQANLERRQQAAERIKQAVAHLEANNMLFAGATARASAIVAAVKKLTNEGISLKTLHKPFHLPLWHPGHQKSLEPAQGGLFYPVLDDNPHQESPEPAQGGLFYPVSPNEVFVCEACLPETSQNVSEEAEEFLISLQGEREGEILPATPTTSEQPIALPAIPMTSEQPTAAATIKFPSMNDEADAIRNAKIFAQARLDAKSDVNSLERSEGRRFTHEERSRCLTIATYRRLWETGDPMWMDEVRLWAKNSALLPESEPEVSLSLGWWIALHWGS